MGAWTSYSGAAVITSATAAWQDLDLSAIVGTNVAVVVLQCIGPEPLGVRAKGASEGSPAPIIIGNKGNGFAEIFISGYQTYLITKTDPFGVIQYIDPSGIGWTYDVFLEGFFIPSYGTTHLRDTTPPGVPIGTSWSDEYIYSLHRPPVGKTALFQHAFQIDTNNIAVAIRPEGETGDQWKPFSGLYHMGANGFRTSNVVPFVYPYYTAMADTGSSGSYGVVADSAVTVYKTYTYWSEYDYYIKSRHNILSDQLVPDRASTWLEVDLSAYTGQRECLAVLQMNATVGRSSAYSSVRRYGSGRRSNYPGSGYYGLGNQQVGYSPGDGGIVITPTDSMGRIEVAAHLAGRYVDLNLLGFIGQYPPSAPVVDTGSIEPSGSVVQVSAPQTIAFRLADPSLSGIPLSSLNFKAIDQIGREIPLITAGVVESGLTGYIAPADSAGIGGDPTELQVHIDWPSSILSGQRYDMTVDATNNVGESL